MAGTHSQPHTKRSWTGRPPRALIVDDDLDSSEELSFVLNSNGLQVVVVHDAEAALFAARSFEPTVIISDVDLPGMSGVELVRELRRESRFCDTPVIAFTGRSADRASALVAGFSRFFEKPIGFDALIGTIHDLLDRRRTSAFLGASDRRRTRASAAEARALAPAEAAGFKQRGGQGASRPTPSDSAG